MMKLILLYNLFYLRREKAFCNECRYCCTLPFCSYKENDSEDNLHLYKKQLYIIYLIRSDFFPYLLHKKIHSQPFFRNNCCRRRTFWWYRRNGATGIKSFFFNLKDTCSQLETLFTDFSTLLITGSILPTLLFSDLPSDSSSSSTLSTLQLTTCAM